MSNNFSFSPTRAAVIKKTNGKYRPLQIPEIRDRLVLKSIAVNLEEKLHPILSKSEGMSFAYQRGKGVREAILQMKSNYLNGDTIILKADIINFFEEVQKDRLLESLIFPSLPDKSLNHLIKSALEQDLKGLNRLSKKHWNLFKNAGKGIPQGNPLSPLLSNVYLVDFDLEIQGLGYSLVRYADDFIVMFKRIEDAENVYEKVSTILEKKFALKIHPLSNQEKTIIAQPQKEEFSFLSIKFDGLDAYPSSDTVGYLKSLIRSSIKKSELNKNLLNEIYVLIKKWIAIYSYLNIERYFQAIDDFVIFQLKKKNPEYKVTIVKCETLAQEVRKKQFYKGKSSFWRNWKLKKLLPKFIPKEQKRA